jgi:hypothetical protein
MRSLTSATFVLCVAGTAAISAPAAAQIPGEKASTVQAQGVITVSGDSVEHLRMAQIIGNAPLGGLLHRSTSSLMDPTRFGGAPANGFRVILPMVTTVTNSELPFGQNDGALWAGKGYNVRALAGVAAAFGPVRVILIPEFVSSTNYTNTLDPTDLRFSRPLPATRNPFSSPFNVVPYSIDLPYRFGPDAIQKIYPGQSSVTLTAGPIQVGGGTENEWWGPAQRNPIVLSDNAAGFPHAFIRTGKPLFTPIGLFEGRWVVGGLKESDFFNTDPDDDVRSLSAFAVTWKQRRTSGLSLGIQRSVYAPVDGYGGVAGNAFDFLTGTGHPNNLPVDDSTFTPGPDQIFSVFAHWVLPRYGLESYIEWGRSDFPSNLRELLTEPNHSRGYTTGLQWVGKRSDATPRIRFQGEFTNVEQSSTYRFRPNGSFYTSRAVPQGYTNEGQMLATGVGPGSSGQWLAMDYFSRGGLQFGANFGRIRFNNDAFFLKSNPHRCFHDVTVSPGVRAGWATRFFRLRADYAKVTRYNAFWQRVRGCEDDDTAIGDRSSQHFTITLSTLGW